MAGLTSPPDVVPLHISDPGEESRSHPQPETKSLERTPGLVIPKPRVDAEVHRTPAKKPPSSSSSASRSKTSPARSTKKPPSESPNPDSSLDNPDLGPFLLKLAKEAIASGEDLLKALDYAIRSTKSFERWEQPCLEYALSLHTLAAIYCSLGRFEEAIPPLEKAVTVPTIPSGGLEHALAAFSGYMQFGDTYAMLGQVERSIQYYEEGLKIQVEALDSDPRVGETCRYLAEAHVQAMNFDKAEELCKKALNIHQTNSQPSSIEEATDRRLMALICEAKGDYESSLENLVLASVAMSSNSQTNEVAAIDLSIGNIYTSLCRFDEAIFSYQKALTVFKSSKGNNHPSVASVFVRLADLYHRTGKLRESKSYCENALRIYSKPFPGTSPEEIATGLTEISAIYESFEEFEQALKLLHRAMKLLEHKSCQQNTIAGIESRIGVMYYMSGEYEHSRRTFESSISKIRANGGKKTAFFGILLNQMGLVYVKLVRIDEAAEFFEESRGILEQEFGYYHQETLGVYSNLAATYDAMGRVEDAIQILDHVVKLREEKLGIANPDFEDEKNRLAELLREAGRCRNKKAKSLENLIDPTKEPSKRWTSLGFTI